jgi:hypothetical protein
VVGFFFVQKIDANGSRRAENATALSTMSLTRVLRSRYVFEAGKVSNGKENTDVSPANMTVREAAPLKDNRENDDRVR